MQPLITRDSVGLIR